MASGRSNVIVGRTGEYLTAAELARRGLIATTFSGNVPHYDIVPSDKAGRHVSVRVKSSTTGKWQFSNISHYCEISIKNKKQLVGEMKTYQVERLVMVFVRIDKESDDKFCVLEWDRLRDLLVKHHKDYHEKHGGIRPRKPKSLHCAIGEEVLLPYQDNWGIIEQYLK